MMQQFVKMKQRGKLSLVRFLSNEPFEWKANSALPLSLSSTTIQTRLKEAGVNKTGTFSSFDGVVKISDSGSNIRGCHVATPLGKILDEKQAQIYSTEEESLTSLDPNNSMWQQTTPDQQSQLPNREEAKDELSNSVQAFYQRRIEEDKKLAPQDDSLKEVPPSLNNVSLYRQISRKKKQYSPSNQNYRDEMPMNQMNAYQNEETGSYRQGGVGPYGQSDSGCGYGQQVGQNKQQPSRARTFPNFPPQIKNYRHPPEEHAEYRTGRDSNAYFRRMNEQVNAQQGSPKNAKLEKFTQQDRTADIQVYARRQQMQNKTKNRDKPEQSEDFTEYSVYSETPRASPVFTTPHKMEDEPKQKRNQRRHEEEQQHNKAIENEFSDGNSFASIPSPEPLFQPNSGVVTSKMKYMPPLSDKVPIYKYL